MTLPAAAHLLAVSLLLQLAPSPAAAAHLPAEYPVCKRTEPNLGECLKSSLNVVVKKLPGGIPSLGVVPIDPLEVPQIDISDGNKNLNLKISFKNVRVTGLTKANIFDVNADFAANTMNLVGAEPEVIFEADYTMNGKFLVLPVEGSGKCKFVFTNLEAKLSLESERIQKSGEEYWDVRRFPVDIQKLESMKINFENLFNGDPNLGNSFNQLMNENWQEFWAALKPNFEETFGLLFLDFAQKVFSKVPLSEVFPQ